MKKYFKYYKCVIIKENQKETFYGNSNQIKNIVKNEMNFFSFLNKKDKIIIKNKLNSKLQKITKKVNDNLNVDAVTFKQKNIHIELSLQTLIKSEKSKTFINQKGEIIYLKRKKDEEEERLFNKRRDLIKQALLLANEIVFSNSFSNFISSYAKNTKVKKNKGLPTYKLENFEICYTIGKKGTNTYFELLPLFTELKKGNKVVLSNNEDFLMYSNSLSIKQQKQKIKELEESIDILLKIKREINLRY